MNAEAAGGQIYYESPDPSYIEVHLTAYQAKLLLIAACERRIEANETGDPYTIVPDTILEKVSGDGPVVVAISQEVLAEDSLVSLLSRFGRQRLAEGITSDGSTDDPLARFEVESRIATGEEALDLADLLRDDRKAFDERRFAQFLEGRPDAA